MSALYAVLLAVTLTIIGVQVYSQQQDFLVRDAAQRLVDNAQRIAGPPASRPDGDVDGGGSGGPGDRGGDGSPADEQARMLAGLVRGLSGPDVAVAVLDNQGRVITSTQALELEGGTPPLVDPVTPQQAAAALASSTPLHWLVTRADGSRHAVVLMTISLRAFGNGAAGSAGAMTVLLEQSASLAAADAALAQLGTYLLLGVVIGTLVGVLLITAFTRVVLRPLDRVADTADAIAGGDLERRLRLPAGRNEVARLGHAFDYMVGRLVTTLEAQRRFVADASHELRTPLTSLKGLAEILAIGAHGNDMQVIEQSAQAINGELDRLSRLVNDLLTLSRLDATSVNAGPPARRTPMDACATLQAAAQQMAALADAHGVRLIQECASPLVVVGDASQIKQVLLNLLDNALRYTPPAGEVTLRGVAEGATARIEVRDTGAGISPQDLPHIFERFYRGDPSRTRATGSSGLGLAIVRAIVEAHDGEITVQSAPGAGTCFTIRLPLASGRMADEQPGRVPALR